MDLNIKFYSPQRIKIFLSYSTRDKGTAGVIKRELEEFGYNVFLAHHDLEPSQLWIAEIIKNLDECDIFIPYLNDSSMNSYWVNQEIGIGFIKNKLIFPLKINQNPWGFISHIQAYSLNASNGDTLFKDIQISCRKLVKITISKQPKKMLDTLIFGLDNSPSFVCSNAIINLLLTYDLLSNIQINEIIRIFFANDQVNNAHEAGKLIRKLLDNYSDKIVPDLKQMLYEGR